MMRPAQICRATGRSKWLIPAGVGGMIVLAVTLTLAGRNLRVISSDQVLEVYQSLANEGAESPKLRDRFKDKSIKLLITWEEKYAKPTEMYRPPGLRRMFIGGPGESLLVKRKGVWMHEEVMIASAPPFLLTSEPRPAGSKLVEEFSTSDRDVVVLVER